MIKTIATDLDGTLFYPKRIFRLLSSRNRKFLTKFLKEKDRHLVLVSGRNLPIANKVEKKLNSPLSMVACNGAVIISNNKIVEENYMTSDEVRKLYEITKEDKDLKIWLFMTNKTPLVVTMRNVSGFMRSMGCLGMKLQFAYSEKFVIGDDKLEALLNDKDCHFYKVMPCYGFGRKSHQVARDKQAIYEEKIGQDFEVLWSRNSLEIMKKNVNKAYALKKVLTMLELEEAETAVAGDSGNDIPLFEAFENSFCMFHSPDEVKNKAKHTIKGVYEIENYLSEKGETK